ncbi:hypothetical protein L1049_016647 [Liquidambar formosana]|uniref:non-specific serine/threonine protein kinase n=1 Tax=Liquidambar formosana TaxID=63359 RepID=A0AAP0RZP2_LIQFO
MGNCLRSSSARVDTTRTFDITTASGASKIISETNYCSVPSSLIAPSCSETSDVETRRSEGPSEIVSKTSHSSAPSSLTAPACSETSYAESLPTSISELEILSTPNLKAFSFNELRNATRNFHSDSVLGEGGFGSVFKGWIDQQTLAATEPGSGLVVAVKMNNTESFQGRKEWLTEVNYLGQLRHPNLVKLIGYCLDGERHLLVYEFMPKGSLDDHLFRRRRQRPQPLSWAVRIKVAIGAARGLCFLHDAKSQVIYRDFKPSNILLDAAGPTGDRTHVSTQVMGTFGYAAPEYVATGQLTAKSDVYGFGVVLLELLSGRRVIDRSKVPVEQNLVIWAKPYLGNKIKLSRIMDPMLKGQYPQKGAYTAAILALQCLSAEAKERPRMADVLATLERLEAPKIAAKHSPYEQ